MFDKSARSVLFVLLVIGVALSHPRKGDHHRDRNDKDKNPPTFEQCNLSINGRLYQFNPQENEITNTKDKEGDVVILNMCGNLKNDDVQGLDCSEDSSACIVTPTADGHITYNFASQPSEFGELRRGCGKRRNGKEPRPDKRDLHKKRDDHDDDDEHKEKHHDDDDHKEEYRRMRMKKQGVYLTYPIVGDVKSGGRFTQDSKLTYIVHCDFESESYNVTDISISEDGSQVNVTVYSQLGCPIVEEDDEEVIEVPAIVPIFFLISTCGFCCLAFCLCRACCRRRRACRNKGYTRVATQESKNNTELQRISINASTVPFIVQPQQHPQMMPYLSPVPQYMNHNLPYFVPLAPMAPMVEDLTSQQIHDDERLARELQEQENRQ